MLLHIADAIWAGLFQGLEMLWETLWAMALGFLLSGMVQAFVSKTEMRGLLGGRGPVSLLRATAFGAASSSCSYAASAMAKSIFAKGADFVAAMVFMFASTNLVIELGVVLAVLIGWQFTASEFVGGLLMIALLALVARVTIPDRLVESARARLSDHAGIDGHEMAADGTTSCSRPSPQRHHQTQERWTVRLRSRDRWGDAAAYAAADLTMLRKEIAIGFLAAGLLAALVPNAAWQVLFLSGHGFWSALENAAIGPLIAMLSFVCSVGNVPLAAALWKGGISFGGVISFIFADLITLPLLLIYRRFYGLRLTLRLLGSFWLVMSVAGLATQYLFSLIGAIPATRPQHLANGVFAWNYTTALDLLALVILVLVFVAARRRRGLNGQFAIDPVCGMQVEKATAPASVTSAGTTVYFCSDRCAERFKRSGTPVGDMSTATSEATVQDAVAIDPVCGMEVNTANPGAVLRQPDGVVSYFCCEGCARKWAEQIGVDFATAADHEEVRT